MNNSIAANGQNRRMSLVESFANVITGYVMTVLIQKLLYPLFGIHIPIQDALVVSTLIVFIAFLKNFAIRRYFNQLEYRGLHRRLDQGLEQRFERVEGSKEESI